MNEKCEKCEKCGNITALITGGFVYEPDDEPFKNGVKEDAHIDGVNASVVAQKCIKCGHIQNLSYEEDID